MASGESVNSFQFKLVLKAEVPVSFIFKTKLCRSTSRIGLKSVLSNKWLE